jgi:hypothetical protein
MARQHEQLPLLLSTTAGVLERSDPVVRAYLFHALKGALTKLLVETDYTNHSVTPGWTVETKLRLRVAGARFVKRATAIGISDSVLTEWTSAIEHDPFADVRRSLQDRRY